MTSPEGVAERLLPAIGALRRLLRRIAGLGFDGAVSPSQREVIAAVARNPGRPVTEVAHDLGLAPNSVSTIVTQLVAAGMLRREVDPADKRVGRLTLTDVADAGMRAQCAHRRELLGKALSAMPPEQVADLDAGITALAALAGELRKLEEG